MSIVAGVFAAWLLIGLLLLMGSPFLYRGLKHRRRYQRFRELPVVTPATATAGELALVTGTAGENERGTVSAPLSAEQVLFAGWEIDTFLRLGYVGTRSGWAPEAHGVETDGFVLQDESQQIGIPDWSRQDRFDGLDTFRGMAAELKPADGLNVNGLWIELDEFDTDSRLLPGEELAEQHRRLSERAGFDPADTSYRSDRLLPPLPRLRTPDGTHRYQEMTIRDGAELTVLGTVRESQTPEEPPTIAAPEERPLLVSPLGPEELLRRYRRSYRKVYGLVLFILLFSTVLGVAVAL